MTSAPSPDDIAYWPDGTWATIEEVDKGHYDFMSDDYEVISFDDIDRLSTLGISQELGLI